MLGDPPLVPRASKPLPAARPAPSASAADLFAAAGEARRARRLEDATRLYRALQTDFPRTPEAEISRLSLGDLYLAHGSPADALAQFDAYLEGGAAPELGEEALLGKAHALDRLGRPADERAVWQGLIARYPQSEYRWRARQRLAELARERP
jgi:outer membrane protein assembly factor BamD (BamD/ComL family)